MNAAASRREALHGVQTALGRICEPGTRVGAQRWPYVGAHPDAWQQPWTGIVLAQTDPRAWENTIAFSGKPKRSDVEAHVAWCHSRGLLLTDVPVLWDFETRKTVHWQCAKTLVGADDDLAQWMAAREAARARETARTAIRALGGTRQALTL